MKKWAACFAVLSVLLCLAAVGVAADEVTTTTTTEVTTTTAMVTTTTTEETTTTTEATTTTTEATTTTTEATTTTTVSGPQEWAVELEVSAQENGRFSITATDETGRPVAGYPLFVQVGSTVSNVETNANGIYNSIGWTAGKKLTYGGEGLVVGDITYLPVSRVTVSHPNAVTPGTTVPTVTTTIAATTTTATEAETDSTTSTESAPTTESTAIPVVGSTAAGVIIGNRTTAYSGNDVLTNVATDSTVLGLFGYDQNTFLNSALLQIDKAGYTAIVGTYSNYSVLLNVGAATELPSETMLNAALKGSEEFGEYSSNERKVINFRLSLLVLDSTGAIVPQNELPAGATYVVKLPVPESMKEADKLAITIPSGNGLQTPVLVEPHDGCIWLRVDALPENYTLIEFTEEAAGSDIISLLLYIAGFLLLAGAGLLLFFFVFRKPKPAVVTNEDEIDVPEIAVLPENDGDDIFSGRTDLPSYEVPPAEFPTEEPPAPSSDEE
ncbi:MAG: hypothetical protein J6K62_00545 [Clostridia bacterium]|nr:hypothetical protein [Clostridia bacterium]